MRDLIDCFLNSSPIEKGTFGVLLAAGIVCWIAVFKRIQIIQVGPFRIDPLTINLKERPGWRILVGLLGILVPLGWLYEMSTTCSVKYLHKFEGSTEGWQYIRPGDGRQVATGCGLFEDSFPESDALRGDLSFGLADPARLIGDEEPRATFFVDGIDHRDWTPYPTLALDARSLVTRSLEIHISITVDDCWYELGIFRNLTANRRTYRFNLTQPKYKTCHSSDRFDQPPVLFSAVRRVDLIIGTNEPETDWPDVRGSVLIDNLRLETKLQP